MQEPLPPQPPAVRDLGDQIRETVRQQVEAARQAALEAAADRTDAPAGVAAVQPGGGEAVTTMPPFIPEIPPQAVDISMMFFLTIVAVVVGLPIARAIARAIDRRGQVGRVPPEVSSQLAQLSQSVEAIAIEVERISEGQRFTTKLLSDLQSRRGSLLASETPENR